MARRNEKNLPDLLQNHLRDKYSAGDSKNKGLGQTKYDRWNIFGGVYVSDKEISLVSQPDF